MPAVEPGHCPTCGVAVQLMDSDSTAPGTTRPVLLEATGMVALVPPLPLAETAEWQVRLTYPLHPPRCSLTLAQPGGMLPR